jgi:hypothetical protein
MNMHQLNRSLIADLRALKRNPPALFVDDLSIEYDRILVAGHLFDAVLEALDLNDRRNATLEQLAKALADCLHDILKHEPPYLQRQPNVAGAIEILGKVAETLR